MTLVRRTLALVSLVLCWLPAVAAPAHAQGPGLPGYLPPGEYKGNNSFADFNTVINGTMNVNVGINDFSSTNLPKPGFTFPPSGEEATLTVNVFDFSNFVSFQGCYFISPSDFMASSDLSNMTLITTIQANTPPCSPGLINNIPAGTVISLQWLGTGPIASSQDASHFSCTAYTQENQSMFANNLATVSGTIPGVLPGPISDVAGFIAHGQGDTHVSGVPDPTCPPGGNGVKGAGPGPQLPGNYEFGNNQAFAIFQSADFTQFIEIIATTNVDSANPQGGGGTVPSPSPTPVVSAARTNASGARTSGGPVVTTSTQVEIRIQDYNTFTFESGCYLVPTSAFSTNGITSAALQVHLTGATAPCQHSFDQQNVPLPLTVSASWTGTGPSAPFRDTGQFTCATFSTQSTSTRNAVTAANKFTLPELFPGQEFDSTPDSPGALSTSNLQVHASGLDPQNCIFRG